MVKGGQTDSDSGEGGGGGGRVQYAKAEMAQMVEAQVTNGLRTNVRQFMVFCDLNDNCTLSGISTIFPNPIPIPIPAGEGDEGGRTGEPEAEGEGGGAEEGQGGQGCGVEGQDRVGDRENQGLQAEL